MTKKKIKMRDLNESPDVDFQELLRKRKEKSLLKVRIAQAEGKQFSMFRTKKLGVTFTILSIVGTIAILYAMDIILSSAGSPNAIPF